MKSVLPVLLLALSAPCFGQTIKLTESVYKAEVGQPVTVRVETDGEIVRWSPVDNGLWMSDPTLQITTKAVQAWAMKPGKYRLWAWTAKDNTPSDKVEAVIVVVTPGPDPGPEPGPNPNPDPKPNPQPSGPYWIIVLEEALERSPETAKILADKDFMKSLTDAGHKWRVYDDDQAEAKVFVALTQDRPAMILTTFSGEVVKIMPMPKTKEGIQEALKGGAK